MKKTRNVSKICINCIIFISGCLMISCNNNEPEVSLIKTDDQHIAMEVFTHSTIIDQIEYLKVGLHDEYLDPAIILRLKNDVFLRQKLFASSLEVSDTIFSYDEIPLIRESKSHTCILQDGTWQSSTDHLTPFETNIIFRLNENPPSEEYRISKTVVKEGHIKIYNHQGELIGEELYPVQDMREFLDTMKIYVQLNKKRMLDKAKNNAQMIRRIKKQSSESTKVSLLSNGHVQLEFTLEKCPVEIYGIAKTPGVLKSRTELSEDMTKTLKFELFQGEYLIQRKSFTYNNNKTLCNFYQNDVVNENPEIIESESLVLNSKGLPVLHHTKEYFERNQTYYYFKN